jgi:N-acetylglucosaminyl-diphospho-decaprenol L-rhamnosyltransferase
MHSVQSQPDDRIPYSIVVVTWQSAAELRQLLDSISACLDMAPEVIVVDNASTDRPESVLDEWSGAGRLIGLEANVGFGTAANIGVEASTGETVVLLNPDTRLIDASLSELVRQAGQLGALVGPRLLNTDGTLQPSASGPPAGIWPWIRAIVPGWLAPSAVKVHTEPWRLNRLTPVTWLSGACIAARRSLLTALGPFDPAIHLYAEDLDLCLRAGKAGIGSYFAPRSCRVVHHGYRSVSQLHQDQGAVLRARNQRAVIRRVHGERAERHAWRAYRLNLALRLLSKRILRRDIARDRCDWHAARQARDVVEFAPTGSPARSTLTQNRR